MFVFSFLCVNIPGGDQRWVVLSVSSALGWVRSNIFSVNTGSGIEYTSASLRMSPSWVMQLISGGKEKHLDRLKKWAHTKLQVFTKFTKTKLQGCALRLGQFHVSVQTGWQIENSPAENDVGVLVDTSKETWPTDQGDDSSLLFHLH